LSAAESTTTPWLEREGAGVGLARPVRLDDRGFRDDETGQRRRVPAAQQIRRRVGQNLPETSGLRLAPFVAWGHAVCAE
jgi:hypothetical protein